MRIKYAKKVLDIGCGTGDFTIELLKMSDETVEITGVDFNRNMMLLAEEKVKKAGFSSLFFISSDVANIPFPDEYFDSIGTAFAFRNLIYRNSVLEHNASEVIRVLKAGGKFIILETSQPKNGLVKFFSHLYMRLFVLVIGSLISGSYKAYNYLVDSTINYYTVEELKWFLYRVGFSRVNHSPVFWSC